MRTQPDSRPIKITDLAVIGILAFLCGLIIGLPILGWWLWPVTYAPPPPLATYTPYPTYTPLATPVPTLTPPPTFTTTPVPDAVVTGATVNLLEGPAQSYAVIGQANQANELHVIGQSANCGWLKVTTPSQLTGWLFNDGSTISLQKSCDGIPAGTFRPQTGVIKSLSSGGEGELSTDNGLANDAVIILTSLSSPADSLASAYIRSGEKFTISGIPDGDYIVFFTVGSEWNGLEFTMDRRVERFEEPFNFVTSALQYRIWEITLHAVPGGTASQNEVPPEEFPSIQ